MLMYLPNVQPLLQTCFRSFDLQVISAPILALPHSLGCGRGAGEIHKFKDQDPSLATRL